MPVNPRRSDVPAEDTMRRLMASPGQFQSPPQNHSPEILAELRQIRWLLERDRWGLNTPLAREIIRESAND